MSFLDNSNFILITLDSCRWDTFNVSNSKFMKSTNAFKKAYSQGTFTLPSHISMFSGIFPHSFEKINLYNRFQKNLFWLIEGRKGVTPYSKFSPPPKNIISGFKEKGFNCIGTGAVEWFSSELLTCDFDEFFYSGIHAEEQVKFCLERIKSTEKFFHFINFGETHEPYKHGGKIEKSTISRARMRNNENVGFIEEDFLKQVSSVEFLDSIIELYLKEVSRKTNYNTIVLICADHGECFGEDGLYGHGFYHEKVMEVPLAIFKVLKGGKVEHLSTE
ncbi:sulfatase-like hydrolase/transferase [Vibrio nigripulchritudo]|uniref:sulfatase-like hydrolase/transferase n=1 Tax=Vibrio nigripulchritudo TaxID=28173 RepID=UPI0003B1FF59|nr:sulfatase-like hydrolase/transferase [Vibrio nigripulchritudo]CCN69741.1 hypothetical protein VIBNISFn118_1490001 [Vibrio nigripulchritudo SFn118]